MSIAHNPPTDISNDETFLQDFVVILKRTLQIYYTISKTCFLSTTWIVMSWTDSNIWSYTDVSPVAKELLLWCKIWTNSKTNASEFVENLENHILYNNISHVLVKVNGSWRKDIMNVIITIWLSANGRKISTRYNLFIYYSHTRGRYHITLKLEAKMNNIKSNNYPTTHQQHHNLQLTSQYCWISMTKYHCHM